jgi:hypothetical protein
VREHPHREQDYLGLSRHDATFHREVRLARSHLWYSYSAMWHWGMRENWELNVSCVFVSVRRQSYFPAYSEDFMFALRFGVLFYSPKTEVVKPARASRSREIAGQPSISFRIDACKIDARVVCRAHARSFRKIRRQIRQSGRQTPSKGR